MRNRGNFGAGFKAKAPLVVAVVMAISALYLLAGIVMGDFFRDPYKNHAQSRIEQRRRAAWNRIEQQNRAERMAEEQRATSTARAAVDKLAKDTLETLPATLSERERKAIFLEMSYAEYAAELRGDFSDAYRDRIGVRHGLSRKQINQIAVEGVGNSWPIE